MDPKVNGKIEHQGDRMDVEYKYIEKWLKKDGRFMNGVDVGCGNSPLSPDVLALDVQANREYAKAQIVWNCHDLELFSDGVLDFVFSSHVLEDFEDIPVVFLNWWKKIKVDGLMILLLPDIQGGRYPKASDPDGNPSHRTDVGRAYIEAMLKDMDEKGKIKYIMEQVDTIPRNESCSIDFVVRKKG
jgi:predicted SAM-dependent methyltransferase